MLKFSVEIWGMLILENNKALEPASLRGGMGGGGGESDPGLAPKIYVGFRFCETFK